MNALFVGDVHNHMYIFNDVEKLDKKYNFDRIIFMGDYVDDWKTDNHQSLETLDVVFNLKETNPEKYTFLIGNHELSYLGFPCSGHHYELEDVMQMKLTENIDKLDFYTEIKCGNDTFYCTHAGLNAEYIDGLLGGEDKWLDTLKEMNSNKLQSLELLTACAYYRGGTCDFSSFVWADIREQVMSHAQRPVVPNQIIGHTLVKNIQIINNCYYIDTHSTQPNGEPYGDKSYLIWDGKLFTFETSEELNKI